jgi:hypothetical protein
LKNNKRACFYSIEKFSPWNKKPYGHYAHKCVRGWGDEVGKRKSESQDNL